MTETVDVSIIMKQRLRFREATAEEIKSFDLRPNSMGKVWLIENMENPDDIIVKDVKVRTVND